MLRTVSRLWSLSRTSNLSTYSLTTPIRLTLTHIKYNHPLHHPLTTSLSSPITVPQRYFSDYKYRYRSFSQWKNIALVTGAVVVVATGAYVVHDYHQAKTGFKKRHSKRPLSSLDLFYIAMAKDEMERRKLGVIPSQLFEAGKIARANHKDPDQWFDKMLLVKPTAKEIQIYEEVAEFYFEHGNLQKALTFWEHIIEPENMLSYYEKVAEAYFNNQQFINAEIYWKKANVPLAPKFALIGTYYSKKGQFAEAIKYCEIALQDGYQSYEMFMQLGHIYLTQPAKDGKLLHKQALQLFTTASELKAENHIVRVRNSAIALNDIGVCIFMSAFALQNKDFKIQQVTAISYLEQATILCPDDPVIRMNLEIVKILNETPEYGSPHCYLQCKVNEPTAMLEAIKKELNNNKTQLVSGAGPSGPNLAFVLVLVPRYENVLALDKLANLELRLRANGSFDSENNKVEKRVTGPHA